MATRPVVLGIAGGSGSGKSTVVREVSNLLGREQIAVLQHDAYYRDMAAMSFEERCEVNFDHPDSLETELLIRHVEALLRGESVEVPTYDFSTHLRRPETRSLAPKPVLILDGILVMVDPKLRDLMDCRVFVDTDTGVRLDRRVRRDMRKRGRSRASVMSQMHTTVLPMHEEFVEPCKGFADIVVDEGGFNVEGVNQVVSRVRDLLG